MHQRYVTQILDKSSVPLMAEAFHIIGIINGFGEYLMRRFTENCASLSNFSCIDRKRVPGVTQHIERHITKTMLALELLPTTEVSIHHYFLHNTAPKSQLINNYHYPLLQKHIAHSTFSNLLSIYFWRRRACLFFRVFVLPFKCDGNNHED